MSKTVGLIPKKIKQPKPDTKPDEKSADKPDTKTE